MATKKPNPSPAPLLHSSAVVPSGGPVLPDLPTEDDAPAPAVDLSTITSVTIENSNLLTEALKEMKPGEIQFLEPGIATPIPGTMQVKIKHLSDRARTPTYGSAGAACFDLYAADSLAVAPGRSAVVPTDLAFEVPEGYVLMIYSRSGHGFKHGVRLANNTGVVDSDYRGHVPVGLHNDGRDVFYVRQGDRIAQAMIVPVPRVEFAVVDELSSTERGANGFGSTGA